MERKPLEQLAPMLAADLRDLSSDERGSIWASPDYVAEEKLNGVRVLLHILSSECRLTTRVKSRRTGLYLERTDNFPHLRDLPLSFLAGTVLDGELVLDLPRLYTGSTWAVGTLSCTMAVCNCSPETAGAIQQRAGRGATFWAFDLIRDCGEPTEPVPFWQRRRRLEAIFSDMASRGIDLDNLKLVDQVADRKRQFYEALVRDGKEGVMLKHRELLYRHAGRPQLFLKAKRSLTVDGFIIGATAGKSGNAGLVGSLLIGVHDAVTGEVREIAGVAPYDLSKGGQASNFRKEVTALRAGRPVLSPAYFRRVVEVEAFCWNKNRRLVHAKLARFRDDKAPEECSVDFAVLEVSDAAETK